MPLVLFCSFLYSGLFGGFVCMLSKKEEIKVSPHPFLGGWGGGEDLRRAVGENPWSEYIILKIFTKKILICEL